MNKIYEYKNKFPFGLEEFAKGLATPTRVAIVSLLLEKGTLSLPQIIEYLEPNEVLSFEVDLKILSNYGIVARVESTWNGKKLKSKYKLNKIYIKLIEACIDVLKVPRKQTIK